MKDRFGRTALLALAAWLATPTALWAHPGHPWIEGAAQPLLGLDHFLAAMLVLVGITAGLMAVAKHRPATDKVSSRR